MEASERAFAQWVEAALAEPMEGWDFSWLEGRMVEAEPRWDYPERVARLMADAMTMLDMGTGGGEFLSGLAPLPARTVATEGYAPNVEVARARLAPLGVEVVAIEGAPDNIEMEPGAGIGSLPFPDEAFDLVINRHESFYPAEVFRILRPGGTFLTQQVGGRYVEDLAAWLGAPPGSASGWNLEFAARQVQDAGFRIVFQEEDFPEIAFHDIGSLVYYLKAAPWQVPGFTVEGYRDALAALHARITSEGPLRLGGHSFCLEAVRTAGR